MKTLHCSDAGFDCEAVIHADTVDEVLALAGEHASTVHQTVVTPEMTEQIKMLITEE